MNLEENSIISKDLTNKDVLLRVDFNVPLKGNELLDDERLVRALPTIKYIVEKAKSLKIITHLGRPEETGLIQDQFSLKPVAKRLSELLNKKVNLVNSLEDMPHKEGITMLENVRFFKGEKTNGDELSLALSNLADIFVMDAFGTAHRKQASTYGITEFIKEACVGFLVEEELKALEKIVSSPEKPLLGIIGGSKISTKMKIIDSLTNYVDHLIIGGALANTCFKAMGKNIGKSLYEEEFVPLAKKIINHSKIVLPEHVVVSKGGETNAQEKNINDLDDDDIIFDVGVKSIENFASLIADAKTIIWNGPMGYFEDERFAKGTAGVALKISQASGYSIIGGGETLASFSNLNMMDCVDYASTAGGAFLEYIELGTLPSIEIIKNKNLGK
ncbi:phosphoglycerate kinase [SAR86 cluster bacterium]|jgi:phosphoglycerate kinase|nr:phosphoglycerate kinase [SAR86 cluster bacterium]